MLLDELSSLPPHPAMSPTATRMARPKSHVFFCIRLPLCEIAADAANGRDPNPTGSGRRADRTTIPRRRTGERAAAADVGSRCRVRSIGCFVALLALISPRLALVIVWLFTDLLSRAFDSWLVPFLGFFLLPWTTLAYAVMWDSASRVSGFEWFIVILAFFVDLGSYAQGQRYRTA